MSKTMRYAHSVEVTVNLGAVIMIALVVWLCVALAGCGTAAPARPAQCAQLLAQIRAFDAQVVASQKSTDVMSELGASSEMQLQLRQDAASPAVPQELWTAEDNLTTALQTMNAPKLNTALAEIRAVCGG
jgi:hypothetical protein